MRDERVAGAAGPQPALRGGGAARPDLVSDPEIRVFGVGMNKTGTTSLGRSLRDLGVLPVASQALIHRAGLIEALFERGDYEPALRYARSYRAFEDRPWNVWEMYRRLDERFPGSRFVLTVRDADAWWRSVERWIRVTKPRVSERYRQHLRSDTLGAADMVTAYERYNREVIAHFAGRDDLLVVDFECGDGWPELCGFLGAPVPGRPFPHANRQSYGPTDRSLVSRRRSRDGRRSLQVGVEAPLGSDHCIRCGEATRKKGSGELQRGLVARLPDRAKEIYRGLQRRAFVPAHDPAAAAGRLAALRRRRPELSLDDVAVVCCFFNPCAYRSRLANFLDFRRALDAVPVPVLSVEMALGDDPFQLGDETGERLQVRARDLLWQKERLLNLGIRELLSRGFRKIVWLDGDVVFPDAEGWIWHVADELDRSRLCQVFSRVLVEQDGGRVRLPGVSAVRYLRTIGRALEQDRQGPTWRLPLGFPLGYSGYGWAARAEVLEEVELYDRAVIGGGDKMIYLAASGVDEPWRRLAERLLRSELRPCAACGHRNAAPAFLEHYCAWAKRWDRAVGGALGFVDQTLVSLYHGDQRSRQYHARREVLLRHEYDPLADLDESADGCWSWSSAKPDLHLEVHNYLFERREDE